MIRELVVTDLNGELEKTNISFKEAHIWDVRDEPSFRDGHIEGAINYPINKGIDKSVLDNTKGTIYILCGGGSKAPRAAEHLNILDESRDIVILTGGTRKAKASGMSIITEK